MPAWILSSFKPARILKSMSGLKISGNITVRKVLMVFQFTLSLVILIFLAAFYQQFDFMASADMGFERENILSIAHVGKGDAFRSELMKTPGVEKITSMSANFGGRKTGSTNVALPLDRENSISLDYYFVDDNTVDVMELKILAGKNFESSDNGNEKLILLNETGAKRLGFSNFNDAVNEQLILIDSTELRIAGVFRDFYNEGVGNAIRPMMLRKSDNQLKVMNIKLTAISASTVVPRIETAWKRIYPDRAFSYSLLDSQIESNNDQTATISLLGFLAFMTIVIASLGLLGLVVYTVETRKKEISIRKVVGAGVHQLMSLLSKGFASLLLIAGCIAFPLGYVLCQLFLQNFANRVSIGAGTLLLSFGLLLVIGLLAVLPQTYMASLENPSKNLSSE
jgi:putative ABC transport system permease protein